MLYELLPVICLLFPPSFNSILQKGRGLNECQVLYKMGTAQDGGCSSSALAMCTVIPARCWKHKRTGRAGGGGNLENRQWGWREKSIGNEASLVWLPVGQLVNWLIPLFSPQFLSSAENYFSANDAFQEKTALLTSKLVTVSLFCRMRGHSKHAFSYVSI